MLGHFASIPENIARAAGHFANIPQQNSDHAAAAQLLQDELSIFTADWIAESPKNYQVWQHRRWLMDALLFLKASLPTTDRFQESFLHEEMDFCNHKLMDSNDHKVYNIWAHKMYVLESAEAFLAERELVEFVEKDSKFCAAMLQLDVLNNSAWTHREVLFRRLVGGGSKTFRKNEPEERFQSELAVVISQIRKEPVNESAWRFLERVVLDERHLGCLDLSSMGWCEGNFGSLSREIERRLFAGSSPEDHLHAGEAAPPSVDPLDNNRFALYFRCSMALRRGEREKAVGFLEKLAAVDHIREDYWAWRIAVAKSG